MLRWYKESDNLKNSILWLEDVSPYLDLSEHQPISEMRRLLVRRLRDFCQPDPLLEGKTVVMSFPADYLPMELEKDVEQFKLPLPDVEVLEKILNVVLDEQNETRNDDEKIQISYEFRPVIIKAGLGLTTQEADGAYRQIIARMDTEDPRRTEMGMSDVKVLNEQKAQIIEKTGVLEYVLPKEGMSDIGGMANLKEWLEIHRAALDDEMDPPKGLLLMGVPGCGKSLMARAVASEWNLPLLALKAANIFDKYVGESEGKITRALDIAEAISPCILWVDEIEKLLAGASGDGSMDSGVSSRIGGSILSWMADKEKPVFVVATANHPERLDPEYVRRGRFNERFFIDLPGSEVRKEIFRIHISRRFPELDLDIDGAVAISEGYTGAEIEACVVEAKNRARAQGMKAPDAELMESVVVDMTPDAVAMAESIQKIRTLWGGDRAKRADKDEIVDLDSDELKKDDVREVVREFAGNKIRDL
jgi:SpoVK/Ycf46/Vps4 family AAA+-type ATPase